MLQQYLCCLYIENGNMIVSAVDDNKESYINKPNILLRQFAVFSKQLFAILA
jgi:hypothetical protein